MHKSQRHSAVVSFHITAMCCKHIGDSIFLFDRQGNRTGRDDKMRVTYIVPVCLQVRFEKHLCTVDIAHLLEGRTGMLMFSQAIKTEYFHTVFFFMLRKPLKSHCDNRNNISLLCHFNGKITAYRCRSRSQRRIFIIQYQDFHPLSPRHSCCISILFSVFMQKTDAKLFLSFNDVNPTASNGFDIHLLCPLQCRLPVVFRKIRIEYHSSDRIRHQSLLL